MTDYINGQNSLLKRPEPGRTIASSSSSKKDIITENNIDTNAIADAVIKAIVNKIPSISLSKNEENFDTSSSMSKLADAMVFNSNQNEANLEGMGRIKETKKDQKDINNTIDILNQLGD